MNCEHLNRLFNQQSLHPQVVVGELSTADLTLFDPTDFGMYCVVLMDEDFGELVLNGKSVRYAPGTLFSVRPGQTISMNLDYSVKPKGWMLAFSPEILEKTGLGRDFYMFSYFDSEYADAITLTKEERGVILNCFSNLYAELHTPQDYLSGQMIRLGIGTLLSYVKRFFEQQYTASSVQGKSLVSQLESLLDKYLSSGLPAQLGQPTVSWCAEQFHLSPNYFGDLVKKEIHITAQDYIHGKIILHAQNLLRQTTMSVNEVAEELGFQYPNHFSRMFHKATGYSPLKFRKSI